MIQKALLATRWPLALILLVVPTLLSKALANAALVWLHRDEPIREANDVMLVSKLESCLQFLTWMSYCSLFLSIENDKSCLWTCSIFLFRCQCLGSYHFSPHNVCGKVRERVRMHEKWSCYSGPLVNTEYKIRNYRYPNNIGFI